MTARYDGQADWYDEFNAPGAEANRAELARLLDGVDALVQANAAALPFADASFDTVVALWISTDVDDFAGVVREAARVLVPDGVFAFYGVHPCFNGPHVEMREDGARVVHPTYRIADWHPASPYWRPSGVRSRVGMRHVPLAEFLNAFLDAGLRIECVREARDDDMIPHAFAVRTRR